MKSITVDGVKYISEADYNKKKGAVAQSKKQIVILQRGWVAIVDYSVSKDGECLLTDAAIIRVWGTTKGLGEIAEGGPTSSTKLDRSPDLRFHPMTVIARMDVNEDAWSGKY
jgi:hypothetical protein